MREVSGISFFLLYYYLLTPPPYIFLKFNEVNDDKIKYSERE